jgi:FMN-dependent NADH-azoreductase
MATILHIISSVRSTGSTSRQLTAEFLSKWETAPPDDALVERDLAADPVPHQKACARCDCIVQPAAPS